MTLRGILAVVFFACVCSACSDSPTTPAVAQVAGNWTGPVTQTGATGGECVGPLVALVNGIASDRLTASITQNGSSLTATASSQTTGQSCTYSGTAANNSVALTTTNCQPSGLQVQCLNGAIRDVYLVVRNVSGTVNGNTMSGTTSESWNVFVSGTTTNSVGVLVVNTTFTLSR